MLFNKFCVLRLSLAIMERYVAVPCATLPTLLTELPPVAFILLPASMLMWFTLPWLEYSISPSPVNNHAALRP